MHLHISDIPSPTIKDHNSEEDILRYVYDNHLSNFKKFHGQFWGWNTFKREYYSACNERNSAGAIIRRVDGHILFAVDKKNRLTLPIGKIGGNDLHCLKLTALRETGEEANIWFSQDDFNQIKSFVDYKPKDTSTFIRLFLVKKN